MCRELNGGVESSRGVGVRVGMVLCPSCWGGRMALTAPAREQPLPSSYTIVASPTIFLLSLIYGLISSAIGYVVLLYFEPITHMFYSNPCCISNYKQQFYTCVARARRYSVRGCRTEGTTYELIGV